MVYPAAFDHNKPKEPSDAVLAWCVVRREYLSNGERIKEQTDGKLNFDGWIHTLKG